MLPDLQGYGVFLEPGGKVAFGEGSIGEVKEGEVEIFFCSHDIPAISVQKGKGHDQCCALVSVGKGAISGIPKAYEAASRKMSGWAA